MKNLIIIVLSFILMGCTIPYGIVATTHETGEENPLNGLVGKQISEVDAIMRDSFSMGLAIGTEAEIYIQANVIPDGTKGEYMNDVVKGLFKGEVWTDDDIKFKKSGNYCLNYYSGIVYTKFPTSYIPLVGGWIDLDTTDSSFSAVVYECSSKVVSHIYSGTKMDETDVHRMTFADPPEGVVMIPKE